MPLKKKVSFGADIWVEKKTASTSEKRLFGDEKQEKGQETTNREVRAKIIVNYFRI